MGLRKEGFVKRVGLEDYVQFYRNVDNADSIRSVLEEISRHKENLGRHKRDIKKEDVKFKDAEKQIGSGFSFEKAYFKEAKKSAIKYKERAKELKEEQLVTIKLVESKLEDSRKLLGMYGLVNMDFFMGEKTHEYKKIDWNSVNHPVSAKTPLPKFAIYNVNDKRSDLVLKVDCGMDTPKMLDTSDNTFEAKNPKFYYWSNKNFPFFGNNDEFSIFCLEEIDSPDHNSPRAEFSFRSSFYGFVSNKIKDKILKAKEDFGKNIFLVSQASWREEAKDDSTFRSAQDFMVVGYSKKTNKTYLIAER